LLTIIEKQGQNTSMQNLIRALKKIAKENPNGFTVYLKDLRPVIEGWAVALKETQNCFGDEGLKKVIEVATEKTGIVGGWKDKKFYWDAVMLFSDEEEATKTGIENEQIAIYQIETNRLKFL
jgi:hypothetical protein